MFKRTTLAATLCALAATPGLAQATSEYRVEASGSGTYKLNLDFSTSDAIETRTTEAAFDWSSRLDGVRFDDAGQLIGVSEVPTQPTTLNGTLKRAIDQSSPQHSLHITCDGADVRDEALGTSSLDQIGDDPYSLSFTPFEFVVFEDAQCTGEKTEPFDMLGTDGDPHSLWEPAGGMSLFEQRFELPPDAVGMGKIVQVVKPQPGQVLAGNCPGYSQAPGERCSATLAWSGTITFTKIAGTTPAPTPKPVDDGDDLIAPLVVPPKPPVDDGDDLIAPLVPAKPKVGPGAKTVTFKASCPAGCAGTAVVTPAGGTRASAAAAAKRAVLRFRVAAGGARTVRLTLPASVRRKLRGAKRAKLVVTLTPPKGAPRRTTLTVALPRR